MSSRPPVRASASRKVPQTAKPSSKTAASSDAVQLGSATAAPVTPSSAPPRLPDKAAGTPALVTPMGWMHTARFLTTAAQLHHLPDMDTPEIAFVGRSNAGKSTCINTLTQKKQLAFASKKPGRTQHINLFALGKQGITDTVLADLPGYGYAAVAKMDKLRWQQVMANYLVSRENLTGIVMMCDPRHGLTELDDILLEVIRPRVEEGLKFLIILTKADKLTRAEQAKALSIARLQAGGGEVKLFSALKKQGVDEVAQLLWDWTHPASGAQPAPKLFEPIEEEPEALDE
jgi:GTP-binding protein